MGASRPAIRPARHCRAGCRAGHAARQVAYDAPSPAPERTARSTRLAARAGRAGPTAAAALRRGRGRAGRPRRSRISCATTRASSLGVITARDTEEAHPLRGRHGPDERGAGPAAHRTARGDVDCRARRPLDWVTFLDYTDWDTGQRRLLTVAFGMSLGRDLRPDLGDAESPHRQRQLRPACLLVLLAHRRRPVPGHPGRGARRWGWRSRARSPGRSTSCSPAPSACGRATSRTRSPSSTRDQLGELAESFNSMTASIEDLLQQKAEKERLEQELRIARNIQMSLLPQGPLTMPGLTLTGALRAGARGGRRLLRLPAARRSPARHPRSPTCRARARRPRSTWRS